MTSKIPEYIIKEPLYETKSGYVIGVYDRRIKNAIRNGTAIKLGTKGIIKTFFPKWIRANCRLIEKVYLRENEPMKLFEVYIAKTKPKPKSEEEKIKEMARLGVFG